MMPPWFVVVCAVMGAVLAYWLVREVLRDIHHRRRRLGVDLRLLRKIEQQERDRAIFEAIARGRR